MNAHSVHYVQSKRRRRRSARTFAQERSGPADRITIRRLQVVHRDLAASPPPFVDADFSAAIMDPAGIHAAAFASLGILISELEQADAVVIATPMHNSPCPRS